MKLAVRLVGLRMSRRFRIRPMGLREGIVESDSCLTANAAPEQVETG